MATLDDFRTPEMPSKGQNVIYVLDTETTGLDGYPKDVVVDIAVCEVDLDKGTVTTAYSSVVGHDVTSWPEEMRNAWIFQNTDLTLDMVERARPAADVAADIRTLLKGKRVTSFNVGFDMDKFLYREPWNLSDIIDEKHCIMLASKDVCKLPGLYDFKWPRLDQAYPMITEGDPARIEGNQTHRALSDAVMASHVLIALHRSGRYPMDKRNVYR